MMEKEIKVELVKPARENGTFVYVTIEDSAYYTRQYYLPDSNDVPMFMRGYYAGIEAQKEKLGGGK